MAAALHVAALDGRGTGEVVRKGLLAALRRAVQARTVLYLGYAHAGQDGVLCTGVLRVGTRDGTTELEGRPAPFGADALLRPSAPNQFAWVEPGGGLPRCLVATFYAGDEALGSLVILLGDRVPDRRLLPALQESAPRFAAALRRAADLDDELWLAGTTAAAIVGADGALGESTSPALRHFVGRRGERLEERVREAIARGGPRRFVLDSLWVGVEPLVGTGSASAYLVSLAQVERPRLASDHALTPRQREVCSLYVEGWSPSRIARRLGLTARSVQRLLRQSLERLGVSDLASLRAVLSGPLAPVRRQGLGHPRPPLRGATRQVLLDRARRGLLQRAEWV